MTTGSEESVRERYVLNEHLLSEIGQPVLNFVPDFSLAARIQANPLTDQIRRRRLALDCLT